MGADADASTDTGADTSTGAGAATSGAGSFVVLRFVIAAVAPPVGILARRLAR